jgi:hypothetical protein
VVPGNARVDAAEVAARTRAFYAPYHGAIATWLDAALAAGRVPVIVSIHSFTPRWRGAARPWEAAVLWDRDPRLAQPLIAALMADGVAGVGDNQPYDGALENDTLFRHGTARGLAHALIEIRQDVIAKADGCEAWAERLARLLPPLLADPALHRVRHFGSRAGQGRHVSHRRRSVPMADPNMTTELEAAVFRRLVEHLRARSDVQNIDLMNLAGFCRNCLSNWLKDAADAAGVPMSKDESREQVYGMPYEAWKAQHQREATPEQLGALAAVPKHGPA